MLFEMEYARSQTEGQNMDVNATTISIPNRNQRQRSKSLGSQSTLIEHRTSVCNFPELVHDVAYLLIIKKDIIYRIPLILDVTRVEESIRDINMKVPTRNSEPNIRLTTRNKDPNERNRPPPETNDNEFCVMLTDNAGKGIETSIKKIFGRCDWLKIVEKCPVPVQVKKALKLHSNTPKDYNPDTKRRLEQTESCQPSKRPYPDPFSNHLSNGHLISKPSSSGAIRCSNNESNHTGGIQHLSTPAFSSNSTRGQNGAKASTAGLQGTVMSMDKQNRLIQSKNAKAFQPPIKPNPNGRVVFRNSISEISSDHKGTGYALIPNSKFLTTIDLTAIADKSRHPNTSAFTRQLPTLFPINAGIAPATCVSIPIFQTPQPSYLQHQGSLRPTSEMTFGVPFGCPICPSSSTQDNSEVPIDLSNGTSSQNTVSMGCLESYAIDLAKPKKSSFQHESVAFSNGSNSNRKWKCDICDLSFETEWFLYDHYGSKSHVCKSLESVDDSESLQKRIKSREVCSEALVNRTTGRLMVDVVNKLIKQSINCSVSEVKST